MRTSRLVKNLWKGVKFGVGMGVGICADAALGTAMMRCVPRGISPTLRTGYTIGTAGTGMVMGSLATELTINQIESAERRITKSYKNNKRKVYGHHGERRKDFEQQREERTPNDNVKIIEEGVKKIADEKQAKKK